MSKAGTALSVTLLMLLTTGDSFGSARSMLRDLRHMVGYTVIASDSVSDVVERRGEKYVELLTGGRFKVDGLILDPLFASDVVVFAKGASEALRKQYPNLPERQYYLYKLLIDDEFYDASPY